MEEVQKKSRSIKKFTFKGKEIETLLALTNEQLVELFPARIRRRFQRGLKHKYTRFMIKVRKAKKECTEVGAKPNPVKTHLRNCIITPEMVGSVIAIHTGKVFNNVEIKFDMIGTYLGEYAMTYNPTRHGRPGLGATKGAAK